MKNIGFIKILPMVVTFCLVLTACNGDGTGGAGREGATVRVGVRTQQVSAGSTHTVAIGLDGSLWAWGDNRWGQLGDGAIITHRDIWPLPR